MPNVLSAQTTFVPEPRILANDEGVRHRPALSVDADKVQADANGNKIARSGSVLYKLSDGTGRLNLRAEIEAAITASSTTSIQLEQHSGKYVSEMCQFFDDGDVLAVVRPYGTITLALTWDADDTVAVVLAGQSKTYTPGSATLATAATNLAAAINADPLHGRLVLAIAAGAIVYLFSKTLDAHGLSVTADTTGDGTATASGTSLRGNVTIGTIDTDGVSVSGGTIGLAAAAAISLPVGAPIGVAGATPYSVLDSSFNLAEGETDISGIMSGLIYGNRLPYWDGDIAAELSEIKFA